MTVRAVDGLRAKLERAREHSLTLRTEFANWSQPYDVETVLDAARKQLLIRATTIPETPLRWSTILGDAIHNYRSVLDHLVWLLAWANLTPGEAPPRSTQFPIVSNREDWPGQRYRVKSLSERHQALIERMQPYHRGYWMGAGPPRQPLEDLRDLSNVDKHRFLMVTTYGTGERPVLRGEHLRGIRLGQVHYLVGFPVTTGTEVAKVDVLELEDPADFEAQLRYEPSIYFAVFGGVKIERLLENIDKAVDDILTYFATERALIFNGHPAQQTDAELERVAMLCMHAHIRRILEAFDAIGMGLGYQLPDPYVRVRGLFDDFLDVWRDELSAAIAYPQVEEDLQLILKRREHLESQGLDHQELDGIPVFGRLPEYPNLVTGLKAAMTKALETLDKRLEGDTEP